VVARSEVQAALEQFLRKLQETQQARSLTVTTALRRVLEQLVALPHPGYSGPGGSAQRGIQLASLDAWLNGPALPGDPATFARQVVRFLPDPCHPDALRILGKLPQEEPPGTLKRVKDLAERTAPAEPGRTEQQVQDQRQPTSTERFEQWAKDQQRGSGATERGPFSIDLLRVFRIGRGLPQAIQGPKARPTMPVELPSEVLSAVGRVDRNLLTPRGANPNQYADAQEVAISLARELDSAQRSGRNQIVLNLGATYNNVQDPAPIYAGIRQIAQQMRATLPHHATAVRSVSVVFGNRLAQVLSLGTAE
jgi:hypothetical protein